MKVKFFAGNLSSAKEIAASEGKLYFPISFIDTEFLQEFSDVLIC